MERARRLYSEKVGGSKFKASRGWLQNFMNRQRREDKTRQERRHKKEKTRDQCEEDMVEMINTEVHDNIEDEENREERKKEKEAVEQNQEADPLEGAEAAEPEEETERDREEIITGRGEHVNLNLVPIPFLS